MASRITRRTLVTSMLTALVTPGTAAANGIAFDTVTVSGSAFTIATVDLSATRLITALNRPDGSAYGRFGPFLSAMKAAGRRVPFAINGGMYHKDLSPVGLYVEDGQTLKSANTRGGSGNFHMLPNGVFWVDGDRAGVAETRAYLASDRTPGYATQSGPMLVIDGVFHRRFYEASTFRKIRNGVGVRDGGRTAIFAISRRPVTFWQCATLFRDRLGCQNALYLDGTISSLHAPALGRSDRFYPLGPIIAAVE